MKYAKRKNKRRKTGKIIFNESTYFKAPRIKKFIKKFTHSLLNICTVLKKSSYPSKVDMTAMLFKELGYSSKSCSSME